MCNLLWKIMTWCQSLPDNLKGQTHSRVSECDDRPPLQVNQVHPTEWSLHPQIFKQICQKWFTPHVDLFATRLNHRLPMYVSSPRPKCLGHRCSKHNLDGSHCLCLPSDGSPSQGDLKNQAVPLPDHCETPRIAMDALVLGPSAALNRDPTSTTIVNNSSQTVPQLYVFTAIHNIPTSMPGV